jgi:hypothetical protein
MVKLWLSRMRCLMTNMDEQIAKYCKNIILKATREAAEQRKRGCEAEDTFNQALRLFKEKKYHSGNPISQHDLLRLTEARRSTEA